MNDYANFMASMPIPEPKFKIGDEVTFINPMYKGSVPNYYYESHGIPVEMIKHGHSSLKKDYKAKVVKMCNEFIIVEFEDGENSKTALGFKEGDLVLNKVTNWRKRMEEK